MARLGLLLEALFLLLPLLAAEAKEEKRNYYEVLEVSKDADQKAIKQAYRKLALKWHPDKNPDNREAAEVRFREVAQAYEILSDPDKRKHYDTYGTDPGQGGGGGDPFGGGFGGFGGFKDPKDLFKDMFGGDDPFADFSKFFDMDMEEESTSGNVDDALANLEEALFTFYEGVGQPRTREKVREVLQMPKWKGKEHKMLKGLQAKYKDAGGKYERALNKLTAAFEEFRKSQRNDGGFGFDMGGGFAGMESMFSGGFFGGGSGFGGGSSTMSSFSFSSSSSTGGGKTVRSETKIVNGKRVTKTIESDGENTRASLETEEGGRVKRKTGVKRAESLSNDEM